MANIEAILIGNNEICLQTNAVFIYYSSMFTSQTNYGAILRSNTAKMLQMTEDDFIKIKIEKRYFTFRVTITHDLGCDLLILFKPSLIKYFDKETNQLELLHGRNFPTIVRIDRPILSPSLFQHNKITKSFSQVTLNFDGSCSPNPGHGGNSK